MNDPEWTHVEGPMIDQLVGLGWTHVVGSTTDPAATGRSSFRQVLLEDRLRQALVRINLDAAGGPWLDEVRLAQAVSALGKVGATSKLVEANRAATDLLLHGTTVAGLEGWDGGRDRTVGYVDWDHPERNHFTVVNQLRIDEASGQARQYCVPDLVLFVNGIPLVVVEAKAPGPEGAVAEAIRQLRRYANQRDEVEAEEGVEPLFWTNQVVVATTGQEARLGSFTSGPEHFLEWKDTAPVDRADVASDLGKEVAALTSQELLTAGVLRPAHLLDLIRHFSLLMPAGPRLVKVVPRYQQYRAVHRALDRLRTGDTRLVDGHVDRRGGVIWHTQGSGKSLTMVFLVRAMRSDPDLRRFKVVVVTDRTNLQLQLGATAELSGETVKVARSSRELRAHLSPRGPGLVMAMIQKYRADLAFGAGAGPSGDGGDLRLAGDDDDRGDRLDDLNTDEAILVLVDEAHRSQGSTLHANLLAALPNAARIGFTGTPIIMGARQRTHAIFGPFLDTYTLRQSERDGSTVPIMYEGRTTDAAVQGASNLDEVFFRWFADLTHEQRHVLQQRYATVADVLEAPELIEAKARDLIRHYVSTVMPGGFKGLVVASSRRACVRYHAALGRARDELVAELEALPGWLLAAPDDELDEGQRLLKAAHPRLGLIRRLDAVPVISAGTTNDDPGWAIWTDPDNHRHRVDQLHQALPTADDQRDPAPVALLIVKSMLLTGFDAPEAQVLYLDRSMREAELLQAIARVNRTAPGKDHGLVVDYFGITQHLSEALAAYAAPDGSLDDDVEESLHDLTEEIGRLGDRHARVRHQLVACGVTPADDPASIEACVALLEDPTLRAAFDVDLKAFLTSLDIVLPRPEARPFIGDARLLVRIQIEVRRRYRDEGDGGFNPSLYREKVRQLVDEHITVLDLSGRIAPIRITDIDFPARVAGLTSDRARASEMEHAARHHIRSHIDEDPARYQKLSERLTEILERLDGQWEQLVLALDGLITDMRTPPPDDGTGLDPATEKPFLGILLDGLGADDVDDLSAEAHPAVVALTRDVVAHVRTDIDDVGFWASAHRQDTLRRWLKRELDQSGLYGSLASCDQMATRLVDLARTNHRRLVQ